MLKYYSPSTKGFYLHGVHKNIPEDAIEIQDEEYVTLLSGQSNGMVILCDPQEKPRVETRTISPQIPSSVSPVQALLALEQAGLLKSIDDYMQHEDTPLVVKRAYTAATEWKRNSLLIFATANVLGLSNQQLDDLFILANSMEV